MRRLVELYLMEQAEARSADRYAELAKHACCKTLNFGYFVVKKPISKRTAMHSTRPLPAAKRLKAAKLKETTAPITVRDVTVGMPPRYSHGPCALAASWHVCARCSTACGNGVYGRVAFACHVCFLQQSIGAEPMVEVRGGNAKLRATLAEKKHIKKIRLATGVHGRKGPTF